MLLLEVNVIHHSPILNGNSRAVGIYLVDWSSGEFVLSVGVKHVNLFKVELESELYELRVVYDWAKDEKNKP